MKKLIINMNQFISGKGKTWVVEDENIEVILDKVTASNQVIANNILDSISRFKEEGRPFPYTITSSL